MVLRFVHESRYEEMVAAMKEEAAKAKQVTNDGLLVRSTSTFPHCLQEMAILAAIWRAGELRVEKESVG